ncbi:MAG: hypothetical protein PWP11_3267, partial [Thauera sp.]
MSDAFHYIGIAVCVAVAVGAIFVAAVIAHDRLIRDRFSWIPFRKGERRLSIASWHSSKLVNRDNDREDDWPADDWPIGERPCRNHDWPARQRDVWTPPRKRKAFRMTPAQTRAELEAKIAALQAKLDAMDAEPDLRADLREVLDWLKTGFITCDHCSHEMQTETLDAVWRLEEIIAALPLAPAEPVDFDVEALARELRKECENTLYSTEEAIALVIRRTLAHRGARWPGEAELEEMMDASYEADAPWASMKDLARRLRAYQTG